MIAIPYRIEADGRDQPITLHESFRMENVTAELEHLAVEVEELRAANSELFDWFGESMIAGAIDTYWLGGGEFRRRF